MRSKGQKVKVTWSLGTKMFKEAYRVPLNFTAETTVNSGVHNAINGRYNIVLTMC